MTPELRKKMLLELRDHLAKLPYLTRRPVALFDALRARPNGTWLLSELLGQHGDAIYKARRSTRASAPLRAVRALVKTLNPRIERWCRGRGRHWNHRVSIEKSRDDDSRQVFRLWVRPVSSGRALSLDDLQRRELERHLSELGKLLGSNPISPGHLVLAEANVEALARLLGGLREAKP